MNKKFRIWDGEKFCFTTDKIDIYPAGLSDTFGLFFGITPNERIETGPSGYSKSKKITIQQFTSLLDSTGKEIYEGDIIECQNKKWEVKFKLGGYFLWNEGKNINDKSESLYLFTTQDKEILGNIHQNPELLT